MAGRILITGGTGTLGRILIPHYLESGHEVIVYSRDEFKQFEIEREFDHPDLRCELGDVRDLERLKECMQSVELVIHAAALKQVGRGESQTSEYTKTNVLGTEYVLKAALERSIEKFIFISTDKAVNPASHYGSTKLTGERSVVNFAVNNSQCYYGILRLGNVFAARGTVVPVLVESHRKKKIAISDPGCTRFHVDAEMLVRSIDFTSDNCKKGEVIVPKLCAYRLKDLVMTLGLDDRIQIVGLGPGERQHETLITVQESRRSIATKDYYVIFPDPISGDHESFIRELGGQRIDSPFELRSDDVEQLTGTELECLIDQFRFKQENRMSGLAV